MRSVVLCMLVCACWRGGDTETEEPDSPRVKGASCDEVSLNVLDVVLHAKDQELARRAPSLRTLVQRRCAADAWSMELRRCVAGSKTADEATACDKLSTKQQRDAFAHDLEVMIVTEDGQ